MWGVFDPDELLPKRPAVKGSWFCEWTDDCLLSFDLVHTYSSMGTVWPCTGNQQNRFFLVVDPGSGRWQHMMINLILIHDDIC